MLQFENIQNNTRVRGNTRFISSVEKYHVQHESFTHCVYYINHRFSTNIKYPEALTGDCLKSDNFHIINNLTCEIIATFYQCPKSL